VTLGMAERQTDLLDELTRFCDASVPEASIYGLLHRERDALFPDELFADLFQEVGRRSIPPSIVATVMVLQRLEGCSDRDAVDRLAFDARWRYACGLGGWDEHRGSFVHTVLVDMRARLHRSERPDRVFEVTVAAAREAGLVGRRRVLDSTALYDAVATMDTVTLLRSGIRGLLAVADRELQDEVRAVLSRDDDYASPGKPSCDWADPEAREALIDALSTDALDALTALEGRSLPLEVAEAAELLAAVVGQDLEEQDGVFRIVRGVAPDRVISIVDPGARHGHKTAARGFDGYKAHVAVDPDSEIITATAVSAANVGDAAVASELVSELLPSRPQDEPDPGATEPAEEPVRVYGDAAYGTGSFLAQLEAAGISPMVKVQPPHAPDGHFPKDRFRIDLEMGTVSCPAGRTVPIRGIRDGSGVARFGKACAACPLRSSCTSSPKGRIINVGPHEAELSRARASQRDPGWLADYRATRPKVERKIAHAMRVTHGGRRARVRGRPKVARDFSLRSAAVNLARLAVLGVSSRTPGGWAVATT
jgi:Transposase DDE domain/Transposase domain (DUF772)